MKKILLIAMVVIMSSIITTDTIDAKIKTPVIRVDKKADVRKATKRAIKYYKKNQVYIVKGCSDHKFDVNENVMRYIMKSNNLKWVPDLTIGIARTKTRLLKYKEAVKYITLIKNDLDAIYKTARANKNNSVYKNVSASELKAMIVQTYSKCTMTYPTENNNGLPKLTDFKSVYYGTFNGDCDYSSLMSLYITKAWTGMKCAMFYTKEPAHGWLCVRVKTNNGNSYWRGLPSTSYSYNISDSYKFKYYDDPTFGSNYPDTKYCTEYKVPCSCLDDYTNEYIKMLVNNR